MLYYSLILNYIESQRWHQYDAKIGHVKYDLTFEELFYRVKKYLLSLSRTRLFCINDLDLSLS